MITMTATEVARGLSRILDKMEHGGDEIIIVRNHHPVAKLVPGAPRMNAIEALGDLHGTLDDTEGTSWLLDIRKGDRMIDAEARDPWE
jgi:antitoxin (DNA-binding transcriptional repressor) of toxin-antitoxin stability system